MPSRIPRRAVQPLTDQFQRLEIVDRLTAASQPLHGWVEVPDQPNNSAPDLPARRRNGRRWPQYARARWATLAAMPHTINWTPADWAYCAETVELVVRARAEDAPVSLWTEIRAREKAMCATWDARQSARIRYVAPSEDSGEDGSGAQLDDYRNL